MKLEVTDMETEVPKVTDASIEIFFLLPPDLIAAGGKAEITKVTDDSIGVPLYFPQLEMLPTHRWDVVVVVVTATAEVAASRAVADVHSGGNAAVDASLMILPVRLP